MRKTAKALGLVVVSFLAAIVLAVGSAFTAALAFGATALIVPGTGTPDATNVAGYLTNARDYYLGGTACNDATCALSSIKYPASFFPLAFIPNWCVPGRCDKWDASVQAGVEDLDMQLRQALTDPEEQVVIFGYSQGGAVVTNELLNLRGTPLLEANRGRIQVVVIGNVDNPAGGAFTRIGFLGRIPFVDVTTGIATPIDTGLPITSIRFEYDGVSDAPKYFGNPLAVLNALAGFVYIHGTYLDPNQNGQFVGQPNDYTPAELAVLINDPANAKFDAAGNKYVVVPTTTLPIVRPFIDLASQTGTTALVKPVIDLISPVLRVLIDLGYDRNENPGVNSPLSILPFSLSTNPIQVGIELIGAVIQGIQDALRGGPAIVAPLTTQRTTSMLAASVPQTQQQTKLALVPNSSPDPVTAQLAQSGEDQGKSRKSDNLVAVPAVEGGTPLATAPIVNGQNESGQNPGIEKVDADNVTKNDDKVTKDVDKEGVDKTDVDKTDVTKDVDKEGVDTKVADKKVADDDKVGVKTKDADKDADKDTKNDDKDAADKKAA